MNKSIQVIITSILLVAAFFTAALSFDACTGKKTSVKDSAEDAIEQVSDNEFFEDDLTDDGSYESDESSTTDFSDDESSTTIDYSDAEDKAGEYTDTDASESTSEEPNTYASTSSSSGKYMIVAGNFLVESNACLLYTSDAADD